MNKNIFATVFCVYFGLTTSGFIFVKSFEVTQRNLKELYLDDNKISNLQPLAKLLKLEELSLNNNNITYSNVAPLWNFENLQELYIHNNPVSRNFCPNNPDALCFIGNR